MSSVRLLASFATLLLGPSHPGQWKEMQNSDGVYRENCIHYCLLAALSSAWRKLHRNRSIQPVSFQDRSDWKLHASLWVDLIRISSFQFSSQTHLPPSLFRFKNNMERVCIIFYIFKPKRKRSEVIWCKEMLSVYIWLPIDPIWVWEAPAFFYGAKHWTDMDVTYTTSVPPCSD